MTARQGRVSVPSAVGENRRRIQILEAVAATGGGGGIQFNSGTYGADNVGDWLVIETDDQAGISFSLPSQVDPSGTWGEAHNNKYGALFTLTDDAPFFIFALNVYVDHSGSAAGFANGIDVSVLSGSTLPSKGISISSDASDGTGTARGLTVGAFAATAAKEIAIEVTNGYCVLGLPTSAGPTGTLWNDTGTVKVA